MLRSMTGFGRCFLEEEDWTQTWEVRSGNSRFLDPKLRLPVCARPMEQRLEKVVKRFATRGRIELSLSLRFHKGGAAVPHFNAEQARGMIDLMRNFAREQGDPFVPDYNCLFGMGSLWDDGLGDVDEELAISLEAGLADALEDWNESRHAEAKTLEKDILARILRMEEWLSWISDRAPTIKEERFAACRGRLAEMLAQFGQDMEESRFLQEIAVMADKLDVSEEVTRLNAHMDRIRELLSSGEDAGRRLDFTIQECFREINTCGNKIQNLDVSRLVVDFKNELEKCREQIQNLE